MRRRGCGLPGERRLCEACGRLRRSLARDYISYSVKDTMDNQRPGPFFPSRASLKVLKDGWGHGKEATAFLVRVFGCDRRGTGQLRASKQELDIERLTRQSTHYLSNFAHLSL